MLFLSSLQLAGLALINEVGPLYYITKVLINYFYIKQPMFSVISNRIKEIIHV